MTLALPLALALASCLGFTLGFVMKCAGPLLTNVHPFKKETDKQERVAFQYAECSSKR